jgi:hypothetical protein
MLSHAAVSSGAGGVSARRQYLGMLCGAALVLGAGIGLGVEVGRAMDRVGQGQGAAVQAPTAGYHRHVGPISPSDSSSRLGTPCWRLCPPTR